MASEGLGFAQAAARWLEWLQSKKDAVPATLQPPGVVASSASAGAHAREPETNGRTGDGAGPRATDVGRHCCKYAYTGRKIIYISTKA
jgi:hypothetical protein